MLPGWLAAAIEFEPRGLRAFEVAGDRVGWLRDDLIPLLLWRWPTVFSVRDGAITLAARLADDGSRTAALATVCAGLRDSGWVRGWRNEHYAVLGESDGVLKFTLERAAVKRFGVRGHAVHVNGLVRAPDGVAMWIATRSRSKPTDPGRLDNLVGGGVPTGDGVEATLVRECAEEAGIAPAHARRVAAAGEIRFMRRHAEGVDANHIHVFDLELPADFVPRAVDGEVERFELMPLAQVRARLEQPERFSVDAALVAAACLERHPP